MALKIRRRAAAPAARYRAFGVAFSLTCDDPKFRAAVVAVLPPGTTPATGAAPAGEDRGGRFTVSAKAGDHYDVVLDGVALVSAASREVALGLLDAQVRLFVAARSPDLVFVHAGVVAWHDRAIAIPGQSFSGKTTLVAALVRGGAAYVSDEYAPLDANGRVHPFLRRLTIRDGGDELQQQPSELGEVVDPGARLELGAIVVTRYVPGATFAPQATTAGQGALALLANTVPAQERPRQSLAAVATAARGG
ncbi:MAG: hypothetical protein WAL22_10525, partial [Solirubrobacteraceae bacterium]